MHPAPILGTPASTIRDAIPGPCDQSSPSTSSNVRSSQGMSIGTAYGGGPGLLVPSPNVHPTPAGFVSSCDAPGKARRGSSSSQGGQRTQEPDTPVPASLPKTVPERQSFGLVRDNPSGDRAMGAVPTAAGLRRSDPASSNSSAPRKRSANPDPEWSRKRRVEHPMVHPEFPPTSLKPESSPGDSASTSRARGAHEKPRHRQNVANQRNGHRNNPPKVQAEVQHSRSGAVSRHPSKNSKSVTSSSEAKSSSKPRAMNKASKQPSSLEPKHSSKSSSGTSKPDERSKSGSSRSKPPSSANSKSSEKERSRSSESSATKRKVREVVNGSSASNKKIKIESSIAESPGQTAPVGVPKDSKLIPDVEADDKWWEKDQQSSDIKWSTLEHNGVLLAPEYVPINVPLVYEGKDIRLPPEAEEIAGFFADCIGTPYEGNSIFESNFFEDFRIVCDRVFGGSSKHPIRTFVSCDFSKIKAHKMRASQELKDRRKAEQEAVKDRRQAELRGKSKEEQKEIREKHKREKEKEKELKEKEFERYMYAIVDGRKERVGNFRVEPPSLFKGRGQHPKMGYLKKRVEPEQITINIGKNAKVPSPPPGRHWKAVIHDNTVTWLASWQENINNQLKYVYLNHESAWKGQSDKRKFDKARELHGQIDEIRRKYTRELKSSSSLPRQRATATYLIDVLALRAGNEKDGNEEADTVGCCSLRVEHIRLTPPRTVHLDFLGKDSIRYQNSFEVTADVYANLVSLTNKKKPSELLFDELNTTTLNKHLSGLMLGLTAKVFRTYNASITFERELEKLTQELGTKESSRPTQGSWAKATVQEKLVAYNAANRQVAILCNHQRAVPKGFDDSMGRVRDRVRAAKYERREIVKELKVAWKEADAATRKESGIRASDLRAEESDLDDGFVKRYKDELRIKAEKKAEKELARLNERRAEGEKLKKLPDAGPKPRRGFRQLVKAYQTVCAKIETLKGQMKDKEDNKTTALGTSKINYIDPRLTVAWCQKVNVPLSKMFNKTLIGKFKWATTVDQDWKFSDFSTDPANVKREEDDDSHEDSSDE